MDTNDAFESSPSNELPTRRQNTFTSLPLNDKSPPKLTQQNEVNPFANATGGARKRKSKGRKSSRSRSRSRTGGKPRGNRKRSKSRSKSRGK